MRVTKPLYQADGAWTKYTVEWPELDNLNQEIWTLGYDQYPTEFGDASCATGDASDWYVALHEKRPDAKSGLPECFIQLSTPHRVFEAFAENLPGALEVVAKWLLIAESVRRMELMRRVEKLMAQWGENQD